MFAAGAYKFLGPLSWLAYIVLWLAPVLAVSPTTSALANGVLEVGFGVAIVANRYTTPTSAVAAVSLPTTCLYLAVMFVVEGGLFGDVPAHDTGLAGLA